MTQCTVTETEQLSFCHMNIQSLLAGVNTALHIPSQESKLDDIYTKFVLENNYQIIALTETWLNNSHQDYLVELENYNIFRRDRLTGRGGGVLVYVKCGVPCIRRIDLEPAQLELLCLEIKFGNSTILLCTCYRPPGQSSEDINTFLDELQQTIDSVMRLQPDGLILVGDFNDRCVLFDEDHNNSELGNRLRDLIIANNLYQLIDKPTHFTQHSAYILDLIIVDCPGYVTEHGLLDSICNLHHLPVYSKLSIQRAKRKTIHREVWHYNNGDYTSLNAALINYNWDGLFESAQNIDVLAELVCDKILEISKEYIPVRNITVRAKDKPWINFQFRKLIRLRNRWSGIYKRTCSVTHKIIRNMYRSRVKNEYKRLKREYFDKQLDLLNNPDVNCKTFWNIVKTLYGSKVKRSVPTLIDNDNQYTTDSEKAELLNTYFASQSHLDPPPSNYSLPNLTYITESRISDIYVTPDDVLDILGSLPVNKASGPDKISNRLLRHTAPGICHPLSRLFNTCMQNSHFPSSWKQANLAAIYKKNEDYIKENYRPISLLSCLSKINERLIFNELYEYCVSKDIFNKHNSGFKKLDGTVNQLINITHSLYSGLDNGYDMCMIFLDVSKAFDKVYHQGLLFKLEQIGVSGNLLRWFESYLINRSCRVLLNGTTSRWLSTNAGVPQGSILGPLLFLIYTNDIVENIESSIYLFADDTSLLHPIDDPIQSYELLNRDLKTLVDWAHQWRVTFNPSKTEYMLFSYKNQPPTTQTLYLGNSEIKQVHSHTHLGLTFDTKLTWKKHVERINKKALHRLGNIRRIRYLIPRLTSLNLYKTLVRPILEYADVVFDNMSATLQQKLDSTQREALVITTGAYRRTPTQNLYDDTGLERLTNRRYQHRLSMYYKMVNNLVPTQLRNCLPPLVGRNANYNLRQGIPHRRIVPFTRTARFANSFIPKTTNDWNNLSNHVISSPSISCFKQSIKGNFGTENLHYLYNSAPGKSGINHTRMRLGLSALKYQLHSFGIIDNPTCDFCHLANETAVHYFLQCPMFAMPRISFIVSITDVVPFQLLSQLSDQGLTDLALKGSSHLTKSVNLELFKNVQRYIFETSRF